MDIIFNDNINVLSPESEQRTSIEASQEEDSSMDDNALKEEQE